MQTSRSTFCDICMEREGSLACGGQDLAVSQLDYQTDRGISFSKQLYLHYGYHAVTDNNVCILMAFKNIYA